MGSSVSKSHTAHDDWNGSLSRSRSVPTGKYKVGEPPNKGKISNLRIGRLMTLKPVKEEKAEEESIYPTDRTSEGDYLHRAISSGTAAKPEHEPRFDLFQKSFRECKRRRQKSSVRDAAVELEIDHSVSKIKSSSFRDNDMSIGLRALLNQGFEPSHNIASPKRGPSFRKPSTVKAGAGFVPDQESEKTFELLNQTGTSCSLVCDHIDVGELFDPSLLAAFEKAVEALSDDGWQSSDFTSSERSSSSSDTSSDNDTTKLPDANDTVLKKPWPLSHLARQDYLSMFERRCPVGCENKIVVYFTSLRAVRKTFENCCMVRQIFKGFGVQVDERDVWMHSRFRKELTDVMGEVVSVPRVFIMGRYIGDAQDLERLHEEGVLWRLLEGLPTECRHFCEGCGDVRFIPCTTCCGSCKIISEDCLVMRCPDCNENGLIMCPMCAW